MPYQHPGYENPPVIEVVFGLNFKKLTGFRIHHVGLAWEAYGGKGGQFPVVEQASRLGPIAEILQQFAGPSIPRTWFINKDDDRVVQIQDDWFLFNWRRRGDGAYPRFAPLFREFKSYYKTFVDFAESQGLGPIEPSSCDLTYINHIEQGAGWGAPHEIGNVLPDFRWRPDADRHIGVPTSLSFDIKWPLPEDFGTLTGKLSLATRKEDDKRIYALHFLARGLGDKKTMDAVWGWFDTAHRVIVKGFDDLTDKEIQRKIWRRQQ